MNYIRYQQQVAQIRQQVRTGVGNVAVYGERDGVTGLRRVETADGGVDLGRYLSNSVPGGVMPMVQLGTIGLVGFLNQKPR
jgi:hypothetical protein